MIEFARTHIIGRAAGHSAVKAAAYRSGTKQNDEWNGLTADYGFRAAEVAHSEILLPDGAPVELADRNTLWNEIQFAEDKSTRRSTAQLAKDHIIALPRELSLNQQIELARDFAQTIVDQGVAVDLNVHLHSEDNPHAHLMTTTRVIDENGIGGKARHLNGGFANGKKVVEAQQLRHDWARFQNQWCEDRGIDLLVTNNDGQWQPELHNGPKSHMSMLDNPLPTREDRELDRVEAIQANVDKLIQRVAKQKAVFTTHDLYRELHKHVSDDQKFAETKIILDAHLKKSGPGRIGKDDKQYFTVRKTLDTELELKNIATELFKPAKAHSLVGDDRRERIIKKDFDFLSDEQKGAVAHVTGPERLSVVIGFAGTGKSTMLKAAARCWKSTGQRVMGAALAGIAAEGLEQGADIKSTTIHSLLMRIENGSERLQRNDILVIDEAGMLDTELMHKVMKQVSRAGAKVVLVGDAEQLQPIQAGGPLRSLSEQGGYCEIGTIRRQHSEEDRKATADLAKGKASAAWNSYDSRGHVNRSATTHEAIETLVADTVSDIEAGKKIAVLAHSNKAVDQINESVREKRIATGALKNEHTFKARKTKEDTAKIINIGVGDRILFRKNDTGMGVKNGSLGTVTAAANGSMTVKLDDGKNVEVNQADYDQLSHGYSMTIHKSQGVTVDQSRVLVSAGWDRHLAYVAMSRHKEDLQIYVGEDAFEKRSVTETISQARIQESAIDFAARHGIEVDENGGGIRLLDQTADDMPTQEQEKDREATKLLAQGSVTEAFRHYESRDRVKAEITNELAVSKLVADTVADLKAGHAVTALAHTNHAVAEIDQKIRSARTAAGDITRAVDFKSDLQKLSIGVGDTVIFNKDDRDIGVRNGDLGTVTDTSSRAGTPAHLKVKLDGGKTVEFDEKKYASISHGYAMTVHKSKSVDIDRARVLVSNGFDRQVSKNAMSQHKKELTLYYGRDQFKKGSPVEVMARERSRKTAVRGSQSTSKKNTTIRRGR